MTEYVVDEAGKIVIEGNVEGGTEDHNQEVAPDALRVVEEFLHTGNVWDELIEICGFGFTVTTKVVDEVHEFVPVPTIL